MAYQGEVINNRRKLIMALGAGVLAAQPVCFGQQPTKVYRIGFLGQASASALATRVDALRAGLRQLGYVEGKNLIVRFAGRRNTSDSPTWQRNWFVSGLMSS